jgi:hypothetical protein
VEAGVVVRVCAVSDEWKLVILDHIMHMETNDDGSRH